MRLADGVKAVANKDGGVALDTRRGMIFSLNPTGALILELLASGSSEEQITKEIARRCDAEAKQIAEDVRGFLDSLLQKGLVTDRTATVS